jgi:phage portal protein BeeE
LRAQLTRDALLHDNGGFALAVRGGSGNVVEFHRLDPATVEMKFDADDLNPFYLVREGRKAVRHEYSACPLLCWCAHRREVLEGLDSLA